MSIVAFVFCDCFLLWLVFLYDLNFLPIIIIVMYVHVCFGPFLYCVSVGVQMLLFKIHVKISILVL